MQATNTIPGRTLLAALLALVLAGGAPAATAAEAVMQHVPAARITDVRLADNVLVIDGLTYSVPLDARIQVNGSYGAFTMLEAGMAVEYVYRRHSEERREVLALRQLSPDTAVPGH